MPGVEELPRKHGVEDDAIEAHTAPQKDRGVKLDVVSTLLDGWVLQDRPEEVDDGRLVKVRHRCG